MVESLISNQIVVGSIPIWCSTSKEITMGIDKLTAYIIASREDIVITHGGPAKDNGKYVGWITLGEEDRFRPLLNTSPIYDTPKEAEQAMGDIVAEIKDIVEKETGGKNIIDHVMGKSKESDMVKEVISLSKEKS